MRRVLHILEGASLGGGTRGVLTLAKNSAKQGNYLHTMISLNPMDTRILGVAREANVEIFSAPDSNSLYKLINESDIVQINWWNNPLLNNLLHSDFPPSRIVTWFHVAGNSLPQIITKELIDFSDIAVAVCPYSFKLPIFKSFANTGLSEKVAMVYGPGNFDRLHNIQKRPHDEFVVGYIGTVDFVKMHPDFVSLCASIDIPKIQFPVYGHGNNEIIRQQAENLGKSNLFKFCGYVEDIKSAISGMDVFGYPLCEKTYAAAEAILQEVMYAGIPPVVFPYGGVIDLIQNGTTGLIVNDKLEYRQALEYLYRNPEERDRLGQNAHKYAKEEFGGENAARSMNKIYDRLMNGPKKNKQWKLSSSAQQARMNRGAVMFAESLGEAGQPFWSSLNTQNINNIFKAEREIADFSNNSIMLSKGYGSVRHYRDFFPDDPYLQLWLGLMLYNQKDFEQAIIALTNAVQCGFPHWRVYWYLALAAEQCHNYPLAIATVKKVIEMQENFQPAEKMYTRLKIR